MKKVQVHSEIKKYSYKMPFAVFLFTATMLTIVHFKVKIPIIILERFVSGGAWIEIFIISLYGAYVAYKMQDPTKSNKWRVLTWNIFTFVFFMQLILGVSVTQKFLMTGELHFPVPVVILGGPIYRSEIGFMTILFLSTIILSGPAWCSHLCYFGGLDALMSKNKKGTRKPIKNKMQFKATILMFVIALAIILRWTQLPVDYVVISVIGFGILGIIIMFLFSFRKGKMYHCSTYCPIGTIVNYARFINPFRLKIEQSACTLCQRCTPVCKYDALNLEDLKKNKANINCTLCGDCITSCKDNAIRYKLFNLNAEKSRQIYLFITVSLHAVFLALAKI